MKWLTAGLLTLIAILMYLYVGAQIVPQSWKHDFLNLYTASYFSRHGMLASLYDPDALLAFQRTIAPDNPYAIPFSRPRFYALALTPLSLLPYQTAFAAWLGLQTALLFACWAWLARRFGPDALILAAFFFPAATGIPHGQDAVFLLALVIASYAALERGNPALAGVFAGCMLFKFHLVLLLPVAMAVQRRWRMLAGFTGVGVTLAAVELLVGGVAGAAGYEHFLLRRDIPGLNPGEQMMVNVQSLTLNFGLDSPWIRLPLSLAALVLILLAFRASDWWSALVSASFGAAFLLPHMYQYDLTWTLLPVLCIVFLTKDRWLRLAVFPLLTPIPYILNLAGMPWSGTTSLCLLGVLAANAWRVRSTRSSGLIPSP